MGNIGDKGKTGGKTRTTIPIRVLKIEGFGKISHRAYVRKLIREKLQRLSNILRIDFTGKSKRALYVFTFEHQYAWSTAEKIGYMYWPMYMGISETVNTEMLSKWNYCEDSDDPKTCTPIFPDKAEMLGKVIANTALHEIGHMFGLLNEESYKGADKAGHTGESSNCMFDIPLHKDYAHGKKKERSKKYVLQERETLAQIAHKKGYPSEQRLLRFRGKDGRSNEEIIKSDGKEIWVTDVQEELKFRRKIEFEDKSFTDEQVSFMRGWIKDGKTMLEVK